MTQYEIEKNQANSTYVLILSAYSKLRGVPNKQGGWEDFFIYHIKNSGECWQIFVCYMKNSGRNK